MNYFHIPVIIRVLAEMSSNEVECKILDHKSNYYEESVKNPNYPTGIKVPILPKFELKPGKATGKWM